MYMDDKEVMNQKNYIMKQKKNNGDGSRANEERTARKSEKSPRRKRRRKARIP